MLCFNDTHTSEIYTLSLHDALPILQQGTPGSHWPRSALRAARPTPTATRMVQKNLDRKSTRLNSSHRTISYAVFCLKKKKKKKTLIAARILKSYVNAPNYRDLVRK